MRTWRKVGCCLAAAMALASQAEDIHLTGGNGLPDAVATQVSAGGGKIYLGDGTYKLTATLVLSAPVEIVGEGTSRETVIIDAQTKCRAVNMSGAGSVLANLTVRNGTSTSTESGGNIYMTDGVVSNCVISGGKSLQSSGSGNVRMAGGTLVDCSLLGGEGNGSNSANGSSVCASGGRIVRCRITDAAYDKMSSTAIALSGTAVMENCLVSNNKAGTYNNNGSVVAVSGEDARVVNCTVVGNVSGACRGIRVSAGQVYNTVMYGNGGTAAYEWGGQNGGAFHNCASTVAITGGADCKTLDTAAINVFEPGGDYVPLATSPLVNTGSGDLYDSAAVSGTDLAGNDRRNGASIDIGCYEVDTTSLSVTLSADIYAAHVGEPVAFTCTVIGGSGGAVTRDFDFGDGKSVAGEAAETVSHAFDEPGFYTVSAVGHCGADSAGQTLACRVRVVSDRLYVAKTGSDEGEATQGRDTSVTPFRTIGYALHSLTNALSQGAPAIGGVTIFVADGDYPETGLVLGKGIVVRGNAADRSAVTVGAANSRTDDRVFTLGHAQDAVLNMTVRNGTAREGGNINMTDGVVSNCVISGGKNNDPLNGGSGGNVRMAGGTLVDCSLLGGEGNGSNSAFGSSVCAAGGRVVRCRITDVTYEVMSSTAIALSGTAVMENCLVSNNKCGMGSSGRVLAVNEADARVVNCTVVGNVSGTCRGIFVSAGQVYNTVMYGNGGTAAYEWGGQNGGAFHNCASTVAITGGADCKTLDTAAINVFEPGGDYVPLATSPLVNTGSGDLYDSAAVSGTDLAGNDRRNGSSIDIGCYEVDTTSLSVTLSADIYAAHVGEPVAFTCTVIGGSGGAVTHDFDFGDGKSVAGESAETVSHAFDEPGFYTVSAVGHCGADSAGQTLACRVRVVTDRLYVAQTGSDEGEATQGRDTSVTPFRTIGYALHSLTNALSQGAPAIGGVTIFVADGDYPETGLVLGKGIVVRGNAADRSAVTVGAANSRTDDRVFTLGHAGDAVIDMTVRNGTAREGGNINMTDGVVSNCVISGGKNNDPQNGGSGGNVRMAGGTLVDCSLLGGEGNGSNSAFGSSVCASGGRVVRCRITDVTYEVMSSAAIALSGTAVMENCLVSNNKCGMGSSGRVLAVNEADARVVNCTVVGNVSGTCRGIFVSAGQVYNTVVYGNGGTAAYEWGGHNAESFIHCAFAAAANYSGAASTVLNVTDEAFQDYANWTADLRGLTPRKNGPLENAGGRIREYEETCRAISSVDLLGRRRCTGFGKLDIGCLETSAAGLAVILR